MGWFDALKSTLFDQRRPALDQRPAALDPDAFTDGMAERLRAAMPGHTVSVSSRLALSVDGAGGLQQVFLENAHRSAASAADEAEREAVIAAWLASAAGVPASEAAGIDDVVPMLKAPGWFGAQSACDDGGRSEHHDEHRSEAINAHLAIVYAIDTPHSVAYVGESWFVERGIGIEGLRRRAVDNLRARLPGLQVQRGGGLNIVVAGGCYEASVLLFDEFWAREAPRLRGDPAIAIPARDVLLFADSTNPKAIAELRRHARDIHADAAYALSPLIFRRRADGCVEPFDAE